MPYSQEESAISICYEYVIQIALDVLSCACLPPYLIMKTSSTVILLACAAVGLLAWVSSTSAQAANAASQSKGLHAQPRNAAGCTPTTTPTPPPE